MAKLIGFMLQDDQFASLKMAALSEGVDYIEVAQRILERGLHAATMTGKKEQASDSATDPEISEFEAKGSWKNAQEFSAIVASQAFCERFAKEVAKQSS